MSIYYLLLPDCRYSEQLAALSFCHHDGLYPPTVSQSKLFFLKLLLLWYFTTATGKGTMIPANEKSGQKKKKRIDSTPVRGKAEDYQTHENGSRKVWENKDG